MPDPILKQFGYGHYGQRAARIGLDHGAGSNFPHLIQFHFFQIKHGLYHAKLTLIWSGWPGQGLAKGIWSGSKPVCRNHWAQFLAERNQPTTSFPLSGLVAFFHRWPGSYCAKLAWIQFSSGWLCQFLVKRNWSGSKLVCKNHLARLWPMLLCQSKSDVNQIWHFYWVNIQNIVTV